MAKDKGSSGNNIKVTSSSSVPGGFGLPNVKTATNTTTGETGKGMTTREAVGKVTKK